ncbi:MAG TPA: alpha/beta fold hydrolase [Pseudogracilibacillus sp.]|nr:alpha/beta fold hydrolase [Pseudogracilibacillus sp.]
MKKKRIIKWLIGIVIVLLTINSLVGVFFYNLVIKRGPKDFLQNNTDLEVEPEILGEFINGDWVMWTKGQRFEEIQMTSFDDLNLKGYYLPAKEKSKKLVVFAHGYLGEAKDMGFFGQYYYEELGFNLFTPDFRGHGESEGDYYGFGWPDRLDIIEWLNLLIEKEGKDVEIVLHGLSMGASALLMASGEELPEQVKFIVADSPYTSVYDMFAYQMKRMYNLPDKPILPTLSLVTKLRADYSLTEASTIKQVKKATLPILYIHGVEDTFVPTHMALKLSDQTASDYEVLTIEGAGHGESYILEKKAYQNKLNEYIERYIEN